ncbi:hypothetical protein ACMSI6_06440 [Pseudomonas antarctica]|uniref:hypothetical protein n=1 Tax=Pseudomonas antarctica TaxID=219572 RepID=UPI0039C2FB9F
MVGEVLNAVPSQAEKTNQGSVVFSAEHQRSVPLIPGYNTLAPPLRPVQDPALSLIALSGIDPTGPVLVEVPLVLNNTTFTASQMLAGWRIGFADRYVRGDHGEPLEHRAAMYRAFDILRQAGAHLVAVDARREDHGLQFTLQRNEIDHLVTEHRLDALVSDDQSAAFHRACISGYPSLCEPFEDGTKLWFYGARWSRDALPVLLCAYRHISAGASGSQGQLRGVLNPPTM